MHILIIPSWYKTADSPMKGTFFEEQARSLLKRGNKVGILYPQFKNFSSNENQERSFVDDDGLPTFYITYKAKLPRSYRLNYYLFSRHVYKIYLRYIEQFGKPDIIHAHTVFYAGIVAKYISKKTSIPFLLTEHFTPFITGEITKKVDWEISNKVYKSASINLVVSEGFKKLLSEKTKLNPSRFEVVHNMVDELFFSKIRERKVDKEFPVFFTVSFLTERKNHELMLRSFAEVLKKYPSAKFRIGGDGPYKKEIENIISELNINQNVELLGELNRKDVLRELHESDIFLLASTFETFGVVLLESLATGMPVITTDSVGPRDIITPLNGIMVPTFEVEDYSKGMFKMIDNIDLYKSDDIIEDCRKRFSDKAIIDQLEKYYSNNIKIR